ncbi:CHAP domain-containing protein [Geomesophilobacter sediminis]|uniref:CHAP domain-containing protein n=1 Tax=Geomesophilobacter sediminis TaxID=2798584 RepID=A0A8J7M1Y4_9BACT|nr:CHAP domain-containing protein [Geomesophilobacter sediminis]MBJ6727204.1 CHAP domain-containing protein [Geomesophilobacter sediminis]
MKRVLMRYILIVVAVLLTQGSVWGKSKKHDDDKSKDAKQENNDNKKNDKKHDETPSKTAGGNHFIAGQCTWFVAEKVKENWGIWIPWSGNAGTWYDHAKDAKFKVGSKPAKSSIIVFKPIPGKSPERGGVGHVAWVKNVKGDQVSIEEMNFEKQNERSVRMVSAHDDLIKGYIYEK